MKHLIIYHAHCNDGFGAAWAAWSALVKAGTNIELHAAAYGKEPPYEKMDEETTVHIVDFSYAPDTMVTICEAVKAVVWLDHHKTALEAWAAYGVTDNFPDNLDARLDTECSGAMLAWMYYHKGKPAPVIILHIQDRDIWKFAIKGTKEVHLNLNTQLKDIEVWDTLITECERSGHAYNQFVAEGAAIDRYYQQLIQNILATNKVEVFIDGVRGLACNCPGALASDIGHILATESGSYGFTWEETKNGEEKISLRSNRDYDISSIAKSFGGGGHKNAAGFVLPPDSPDCARIKFKPLV